MIVAECIFICTYLLLMASTRMQVAKMVGGGEGGSERREVTASIRTHVYIKSQSVS